MSLNIRTMTADDIALGMDLKHKAGWNQLAADWQRFLALEPTGCFVCEVDGTALATGTTCVFDDVAWIAMLLVDPAARGKGVGTAMMNHMIAYLDGREVSSIRLDATPAGRPIYERLGFVAQMDMARMEGALPKDLGHAHDKSVHITSFVPGDLSELALLDQRVTRTMRQKMLRALTAESPERAYVARRDGEVVGYAMSRAGANAHQIGPAVALDPAAGEALLHAVAQPLSGERIFWDVALDNAPACDLAEKWKLEQQRPFTRMCRGKEICDHPQQLWASSGPEKG